MDKSSGYLKECKFCGELIYLKLDYDDLWRPYESWKAGNAREGDWDIHSCAGGPEWSEVEPVSLEELFQAVVGDDASSSPECGSSHQSPSPIGEGEVPDHRSSKSLAPPQVTKDRKSNLGDGPEGPRRRPTELPRKMDYVVAGILIWIVVSQCMGGL